MDKCVSHLAEAPAILGGKKIKTNKKTQTWIFSRAWFYQHNKPPTFSKRSKSCCWYCRRLESHLQPSEKLQLRGLWCLAVVQINFSPASSPLAHGNPKIWERTHGIWKLNSVLQDMWCPPIRNSTSFACRQIRGQGPQSLQNDSLVSLMPDPRATGDLRCSHHQFAYQVTYEHVDFLQNKLQVTKLLSCQSATWKTGLLRDTIRCCKHFLCKDAFSFDPLPTSLLSTMPF